VPHNPRAVFTREHDELTAVDALAQLSFLVYGTLERLAAEHGLSIPQARLLGILRDRTPTMIELAKLLSLDKSSITGLVSRAERRGLVKRTPSATDRRSTTVRLTRNGRALVSRAATQFETQVSAFLDCLQPSERGHLTNLASRILAAHASSRDIDLFPATRPDAPHR